MGIATFLTIVGIGASILVVVLAAWVNIRIAVARLEVKVSQLDKDLLNEKQEMKEYKENNAETLIKIFNVLEEIKIKIASQK